MSQSASTNRSLTFRRTRAGVFAGILILALAIIFVPNGAVVTNFIATVTGVALLATVAMLPKAYAAVERRIRTFL